MRRGVHRVRSTATVSGVFLDSVEPRSALAKAEARRFMLGGAKGPGGIRTILSSPARRLDTASVVEVHHSAPAFLGMGTKKAPATTGRDRDETPLALPVCGGAKGVDAAPGSRLGFCMSD